jgi:hypothetical protein
MWEELGISGGTALIVLIALYFIIRNAVKSGVYAALKKRDEEKNDAATNADNNNAE